MYKICLVILCCFLLFSCGVKSKDFSDQIDHYIEYRGLNCAVVDINNSSNFYTNMLESNIIVYKNNRYVINPNLESQIYVANYDDSSSNYNNESFPLICKNYQLKIKSIEQLDNGDLKQVYFSIDMPNIVNSVVSSGEYTAKFGIFDNNYKLKEFNGHQLSIDDTLKVYDYKLNIREKNTDFTLNLKDELTDLSKQCAPQVSPTTMTATVFAYSYGNITNLVKNNSLCSQMELIGENITDNYVRLNKVESDQQKALKKALNDYGNSIKRVKFAESVVNSL